MGDKNLLFSIGTEVEVIKEGLQSFGLTGIIIDYPTKYPNCVIIRFDDWNGKGKKELYVKKENVKLKGVTKEMAVKGNYKVALVKFLQGSNTTKEYAFALFDDSIKENDTVLCDTSYGYGVARVEAIKNQEDYIGVTVTKEIICKVDFTDFNNRIETRKRQEVIKKQMDNLVKQNQELVLYEMIAKQSPEMAAMLEEYKQLMTV